MPSRRRNRTAISFAAALFTSATLLSAAPTLTQVATFDHQVTGVSVSKDGRIFVNFPRWSEDAPVSVAELKDGKPVPYPNDEWNAWRNDKKDQLPADQHFVCVQSVVVDPGGSALWVVDAGNPNMGGIVPKAPKLVKIDLSNNQVAQTITVPDNVAIPGSYLNDIRFSPDVRYAYLTDSGQRGAIIVVDLQRGQARRLLDGHPSTQPEPGVVVHADGKELRRPDDRSVVIASDGIEISKDGQTLYWQALTGHTLYSIATNLLTDPNKSADEVAAGVKPLGKNGVADGLLLDNNNRLYISALEENAIKTRELTEGSEPQTLIQDKSLRWPDTFSLASDGTIYVTTSHIQDSAWFHPDAPKALRTELWKIEPQR